jgi:hypothetical protein
VCPHSEQLATITISAITGASAAVDGARLYLLDMTVAHDQIVDSSIQAETRQPFGLFVRVRIPTRILDHAIYFAHSDSSPAVHRQAG